jgi:hypothetical protein
MYLCVCESPPTEFRMPDPISMELGMADEPTSTANFINPSHQSVSVCLSLLSLLGNGSVKCIPLSLLGKNSVKTFPGQRRIFWRRRYILGPCRIKEEQAISSSHNFLYTLRCYIRYVWNDVRKSQIKNTYNQGG